MLGPANISRSEPLQSTNIRRDEEKRKERTIVRVEGRKTKKILVQKVLRRSNLLLSLAYNLRTCKNK
jgi:hypothetical protein